jgi:D-amino-acid dehydrogenase
MPGSRVTVAGGGVIGLGAAYELVKDGHDVTVVDSVAPGFGAAAGSAAKIALAETGPVPAPGMIRQGLKWMLDPESPFYVRPSLAPDFVRFLLAMARHCTRRAFQRGLELNLELTASCLEGFDAWRDEGVVFEEHRRGVLLAFEHDASFRSRRELDATFDRFGHVSTPLAGPELHELEPALSERITHALLYEADRQVNPVSLMAALLDALRERGATVIAGEPVTGFEQRGGRVTAVRTPQRAIACDTVVLAAGAHTGGLAKRLGARLPVQAGKGYSVHYPDPPTRLKHGLTFEDPHVAVAPLDTGLRVAGTMEFSGFDTRVTPRRVAAVKAACRAGFADWDDSKAHEPAWAGLRPVTPDGLPVIGPLPAVPNAIVATGHAMLGLTQTPATARAVTAFVRGEAPSPALAALGPQRF